MTCHYVFPVMPTLSLGHHADLDIIREDLDAKPIDRPGTRNGSTNRNRRPSHEGISILRAGDQSKDGRNRNVTRIIARLCQPRQRIIDLRIIIPSIELERRVLILRAVHKASTGTR